mmetsp:Transcript_67953/g.210183  ORF Transcript_67953/g.210183 Transcript_67953/m.210183 type:complete len:661 (+) Transcript_67953:59-2041(+)
MGCGASTSSVKGDLKSCSEADLKIISSDLSPEQAARIRSASGARAAGGAAVAAEGNGCGASSGEGVASLPGAAPAEKVVTDPSPKKDEEAPLPDLGELYGGDGCSIEKTEERAITVQQLGRILAYITNNCTKLGWRSTNPAKPGLLSPSTVNLYDLTALLIKPATKARQCAYVELVAARVQVPKWFVSHWWGEPVHDFVICITKHASDRGLPETTAYWVCAYANNQWQLAGDVSDDPANSSFRKAIDLAAGTVTVLDRGAVTFSRVWCAYEIFVSLQDEVEERKYSYDVYTMYTDVDAVGITDGVVEADRWRGEKKLYSHQWVGRKAEREMNFPQEVTQDALATEVQKAQASVESDRVHILNAIVCSKDLNADIPIEDEKFDALNRLLRGRFAAGMYRAALASGKYVDLIASALRDSGLTTLCLGFDGQRPVDVVRVTQDLPQAVVDLDLSLMDTGMTAAGCEALGAGLPCSDVTHLKLVLDRNSLGDDGVVAVGRLMPRATKLRMLDLRLSRVGKTDAGVEGLSDALGTMTWLDELRLYVQDDEISGKAAEALGRAFSAMTSLRTLRVNVDRTKIDDEAFAALSAVFGKLERVTWLVLWARHNGLSSAGVDPLVEACQKMKLTSLKLELNNNNISQETKDKFEQLKRDFRGSGGCDILL